jgi:hypothetical protein
MEHSGATSWSLYVDADAATKSALSALGHLKLNDVKMLSTWRKSTLQQHTDSEYTRAPYVDDMQ